MRTLALLALALVSLTGAHTVGGRAEVVRNAGRDLNDLMYLPEGRLLRSASLGHTRLMADLVWLRAIQYYGEQRLTTRNYDQTARLFNVIYDLDPEFKGATRFGALILSQDAADPEGALALLDRAAQDHPDDWEYPFDQGFIHHTVRGDLGAAAVSYRESATMPGAPDLASRLAGVSFSRLGDRASARTVWEGLLADGNAMARSIAERNLRNLDLETGEESLTNAVRGFLDVNGRVPANWEELITAGHLDGLPGDPWGGAFFWVPENGEVLSSTTIDRRMAAIRDLYRGAIVTFERGHGRRPESLEQIEEQALVQVPLWRPFGLGLEYDRATGRVAWNPPWAATEPETHGEGHA